jgi:hypothetical protein
MPPMCFPILHHLFTNLAPIVSDIKIPRRWKMRVALAAALFIEPEVRKSDVLAWSFLFHRFTSIFRSLLTYHLSPFLLCPCRFACWTNRQTVSYN